MTQVPVTIKKAQVFITTQETSQVLYIFCKLKKLMLKPSCNLQQPLISQPVTAKRSQLNSQR